MGGRLLLQPGKPTGGGAKGLLVPSPGASTGGPANGSSLHYTVRIGFGALTVLGPTKAVSAAAQTTSH